MAQIATSDVTYTFVDSLATPSRPMPDNIFKIAFGNGTLTYTNGGIPLQKAKLGCPANIRSLTFIGGEAHVGIFPQYNVTAGTIQLFRQSQDGTPTTTHLNLVEFLTSAAVSAMSLRVRVEGF